MQIHPLLQRPIYELPFSPGFLTMASENGIPTLSNLLARKVHEMMNLDGFNYHLLDELVKFLRQNGLTQYLKES